jgi:hypothetical protein
MRRIITVNVPKVKTHRNSIRPASRFGAGLVRALPSYRTSYTFSDAQWWAAEQAAAEDRRWDALADQAAFQDRYERGLAC